MRNIPSVYPAVILSVGFTGTQSAGSGIIKGFYKFTLCILRMEEFCFRVENIPIVFTPL